MLVTKKENRFLYYDDSEMEKKRTICHQQLSLFRHANTGPCAKTLQSLEDLLLINDQRNLGASLFVPLGVQAKVVPSGKHFKKTMENHHSNNE
jgi:hypothetical protein